LSFGLVAAPLKVRVEEAHGVDAAVEGFVSDAFVFVPFAHGKSFDEFGAGFFGGELSCRSRIMWMEKLV
jgi:hypothetical protein